MTDLILSRRMLALIAGLIAGILAGAAAPNIGPAGWAVLR